MRRAAFAFALIAGIVSGISSLFAQARGDLNWPDTPIVDEVPVQQKPKPKPVQSETQPSVTPSLEQSQGTQAAPDTGQATSSARPARTPSTQQSRSEQGGETRPRRELNGQVRPRGEREEEARPRREATREPSSRDAETQSPPLPPVPGRREAATPRQAVPVTVSLAQTLPAPAADDGLGKIIGQMLMVGFQGTAPDESWPRQVIAQIESGKLGGVLVMSHNVLAPEQLARLTAAIGHTKAQIAPFIAVDQEGGSIQRLPPGFQQYASAAELGMSNDPLNAYNLYQRMAIELAAHGFNVNFGPVVDLDQTRERGAAGNERRYGTQPKHVAAFAKAFRLAHHSEGLLTVLKYFPGLTSAKPESNSEGQPDARWDAVAIEPYRQLVAGGNADMVMVGHLSHAEFSDEPGLPASLSQKAIQTRLREEIGFKGVIIADDLEAKAVAARFPLEESVVRAIKAGNDLLLFNNLEKPSPDLPERVATIIRQAVTTGVLTRERLQASYDRIIAAKQSLSQAAREMASAKQSDGDEEKPAAP